MQKYTDLYEVLIISVKFVVLFVSGIILSPVYTDTHRIKKELMFIRFIIK